IYTNMKKIFASTLLLLIGLGSAYAQRDTRHFEKGVVSVTNNDTVNAETVERHLAGNTPGSPKDNGLPRFAIVGKDHKFYMGIGVQFLGEAVFDFGDEMSSVTSFTPSALTPSTPGNRSSLGFGWQTSSFYMNVLALPGERNQVGLFFKANFTGSNNTLHVKHLYAKYRGLLIGHTTSLFTDAAAEPMTIDYEGPNGYPFLSVFTASWTQNFTKNLSGAIAVESTTTALTTNGSTEQVNQRIPVIPLYLQYAWNGGKSHARISGIFRAMQYRNLSSEQNKVLAGMGVQLSGMNQIYGPLSWNYNIVYGRGISTYLQDDTGLNLDAVPTTKAGKLEMVKNLGLTAGLNYKFSSKVSTNLVFSHLVNYLPDNADISTDTYRYGDYFVANVLYNFNRFVGAGIEYDYGLRKDFAGNILHSNRLQVQMSVTF
ncbi:MAG: hypothetical protein K2H39_08145, partial [Paramuribaculum sp.]|nr:hypothetical protein [Paramuribaculum sp.]